MTKVVSHTFFYAPTSRLKELFITPRILKTVNQK